MHVRCPAGQWDSSISFLDDSLEKVMKDITAMPKQLPYFNPLPKQLQDQFKFGDSSAPPVHGMGVGSQGQK